MKGLINIYILLIMFFLMTSNLTFAIDYDDVTDVEMDNVLNIKGKYGIAVAGGSNLKASLPPVEEIQSSHGTIYIPKGAKILHAFLYYSGKVGIRGEEFNLGINRYTNEPIIGDHTDDNLNNAEDVRKNGISFSLNGVEYGPFDVADRKPWLGSKRTKSFLDLENMLVFHWGTLTDGAYTDYLNRLDITKILKRKYGLIDIIVHPPERIDLNLNNASHFTPNPGGTTHWNLCSSGSDWALIAVYKHNDLSNINLVLKDATSNQIPMAWDLPFVTHGKVYRPRLQIEHEPITSGSKIYMYGYQRGIAGKEKMPGVSFPDNTYCSSGGLLDVGRYPDPGVFYYPFFSEVQLDFPEVVGTFLHRDRTNGPWGIYLTGTNPQYGNTWTLFNSGDKYTEFPNLFDFDEPEADGIYPYVEEWELAGMVPEIYGGHPWEDAADIIYHGSGHNMAVIEMELDDSIIEEGEDVSYLTFKGDQRGLLKPTNQLKIRFVAMEIPVECDDDECEFDDD